VASIIFSVIVFGLFTLLIILFETVVKKPRVICGGSRIEYDTGTAFALVMTYRGIFSGIALLLGISLFITGLMLVQLLKDPLLVLPPGTLYRITAATFVGSFGLLAQAIYYLVLTALRRKQSVYLSLSILLIDEIIPALLFLSLAVVHEKEGTGLKATTTGGSLTKTQSRSKKSGSGGSDTKQSRNVVSTT